MSKTEKSLFIFEGAKSEGKFVKTLEKYFLDQGIAVKSIYDAEVYQLYKQLKADDFALDIVNLLKERKKENRKSLKGYNRKSFAYIYLFFDYDAHSTLADDKKLVEMLSFFDNETENGMLYVSYPMVEALRHYKGLEDFRHLTVKCKRGNCPNITICQTKEECQQEPHYKDFSANDCWPQLTQVNKYDFSIWKELIIAHLYKMNDLVNDSFSFPTSISSQLLIFTKQMKKYISQQCPHVAVLSAFPLFVLDYYGCLRLKKKLGLE